MAPARPGVLRAENEAVARAARDEAIEASSWVNWTVWLVRERRSHAELLEYRRACAQLIGALLDVASRAGFDFPALMPDEVELSRVTEERIPDLYSRTPMEPLVNELLAVLDRVTRSLAMVRGLAPDLLDEQLPGRVADVEAIISRWASAAPKE